MVSNARTVDGEVVEAVEPQDAAPAEAQTPVGEVATTTPETIDRAEHDRIVAEWQQKYHSVAGRLKTNVPDQMLNALRAEQSALQTAQEQTALEVRRLRLEGSDMDESQRRAASNLLSRDAREAAERADFSAYAQERADDLTTHIQGAPFLEGNAELALLLEEWNRPATGGKPEVLQRYRDITRFIETAKDEHHDAELKAEKERGEQERKRANQATGSLEVGAPRGTPVGGNVSWAAAQKIKTVEDLSDEAYEKLIQYSIGAEG